MADTRFTIGLLLAGVGLLVSILLFAGEPFDGMKAIPLLVGFAALAGVSFSARRHGMVGQTVGAIGAGLGGMGLVIGGTFLLLVQEGSGYGVVGGLAIALVGMLCVGIARADYTDAEIEALVRESRVLLLGAAVGFGGLFVAGVFAMIPSGVAGILGWGVPSVPGFALSQLGMAVGLVVATLAFVVGMGRGVGYLDITWPSGRDIQYMLFGTIGVLLLAAGIQAVLVFVGVEFAQHEVEQRAQEDGLTILLVAIVFSFITNGLGEELLYRNGVQKYFTEWFSPVFAIVASSVLFALGHFPAYYDPDPVGMIGSLLVVFSLSLVLGIAYHRTENILVPIVIHGSYNAVVWLVVAAQLLAV